MGTQVDLFLDTIVNAPLKDDRALMEFPFFSIQKQPRKTPLEYVDGDIVVRISPGEKGIATIWDKDILIYIASIINERIERGLPVDRTVTFHAYDLLKITGRGLGKRAYELLLDALFRLRSTTIQTSIQSGNLRERRGFGWIETWRVIEHQDQRGRQVMAAIEITLNDWMFRAIVQDRRVLTINKDYFALESGLERRLYELARKHVGNQKGWKIGLEKLASKIGTTRTLRFFKRDLLAIIEKDNIPDYTLFMESDTDGGRPIVHFRPR